MPRVLKVTLEAHFLAHGASVHSDVGYDYDYWQQYLAVFDEVEPIARVQYVDRLPDGYVRADGPRVRFRAVREYLCFWQFLRHAPAAFADCRHAIRGGFPLLRMGNVALMCWVPLLLTRRPYAVEVLFHAREIARTVENVQRFRLAEAIAAVWHFLFKIQVSRATLVSYVSRHLADAYPARTRRVWHISDVHLPERAYSAPRSADAFDHRPTRLVTVGRMSPEKGVDVLLQALELLKQRSAPVVADVVGPGPDLPRLRELAAARGLDTVRFLGPLPAGDPIRACLDRADLFVLPSYTEGLPRALLEAMARGLPAVATRVGAVPQLLPERVLVSPGDPVALADRIALLAADPAGLAELSAAAVSVAREYHADILDRRRRQFWEAILAMDGAAPPNPGDSSA
jgi:glycosyltransferase involved in cell wall biosynthesis